MIGTLQKPLSLPDLEAVLMGQLVNAQEPTERDLRQAWDCHCRLARNVRA